MRIISGKHRGRIIESVKEKKQTTANKLRPTTGKVREAVFNMLCHSKHNDGMSFLNDAVVLDLFCGSGAFSMEALSRGAKKAILIDVERAHLEIAKLNIEKIREQENAEFFRHDATIPPMASEPANVVFLDPPYRKNLVKKAIKGLFASGWIKLGSVLVIETGPTEDMKFDGRFEELEDRKYGNCRVRIVRVCRDI